MSDVNDDMDELFKRAGENYPLNTDSADWNEVHKALQFPKAGLSNTSDKKKSRKLLWLLLLLPLTFAINKYVFNPVHQNITGESLSKEYKAGARVQENIPGNDNNENLNKIRTKETLTRKNNVVPASKNIANKAPLRRVSPAVNNNTPVENIPVEEYSPGKSSNTTAENIDVNVPNNVPGRGIKTGVIKNKDAVINKNVAVNEDAHTNEDIAQITTGTKDTDTYKDINDNPGPDPKIEKQDSKLVSASDSVKHNTTVIAKANKPKNRKQHLYAGIIGGPDLSTIKFQKVIKTGFTAGIIAGYRFNKKWSIESGLYLEKKYYYSKGKYFNTEKTYIPSWTKIENLDGDCHMIELPVNLKYDFKSNKKVSWFAIIGSSSYLMKKENYGYRYKNYWQVTEEKEVSFKNSSKNWASVINLGIGYSRNVGKTAILRLEPYLKIPLKGVGVGSLPITSTGVYLGLTKNLF